MQKSELPPYVEKAIAKKDPNWHQIYIPSINDQQLLKLIELLNQYQNPYITTLKLPHGSITNVGIAHFANMPVTIVNVYLSDHNLTEGVAPVLMQVFSRVINLDLSDNHISREDAKYLAHNATQHWINVAGNRELTEEDRDNITRRTVGNIEEANCIKSLSSKLSAASRFGVVGCNGTHKDTVENNNRVVSSTIGFYLPTSFGK